MDFQHLDITLKVNLGEAFQTYADSVNKSVTELNYREMKQVAMEAILKASKELFRGK